MPLRVTMFCRLEKDDLICYLEKLIETVTIGLTKVLKRNGKKKQDPQTKNDT
jgi:hypothetical protein